MAKQELTNPFFPGTISEELNATNLILHAKDSYQSHLARLQEHLTIQSIGKGARNRIHSFNLDAELPATLFIMPNTSEGSVEISIPKTFSNFILTGVQEDRREKFQIFETFGDPALFFFDKKTPIYGFSGFLIDSDHVDSNNPDGTELLKGSWANVFRELWESEFRGTQLIKNNAIAAISYSKTIVYGYPINLSIQTDSRQPHTVAFSFNMVVKKHKLEQASSNALIAATTYMTKKQSDDFNISLKNLKVLENDIKTLQTQYEVAVTAGESRESLEKTEKAISSKYTTAEETYLRILKLIQFAINGSKLTVELPG